MTIYIYSFEGQIQLVNSSIEKIYIAMWEDFKWVYGWQNIYYEYEEEAEAFIEFCNEVKMKVFEGEFDITEWKI